MSGIRPVLALLIVLPIIAIAALGVGAQSAPVTPLISVSPGTALDAVHTVQASGLPVSTTLVLLLISPGGAETATPVETDGQGSLTDTLPPPDGGWETGVYRVAVGLPDGQAISAIFGAGDGQPHLLAEPYLPSPTSAFIFEGVGYPDNSPVTLTVHLTAGETGDPVIHITTDGDGNFVAYLWPVQVGYSFFAAGIYAVDSDTPPLTTTFTVREHPVSAAISVNGAAPFGGTVPVSFAHYRPGRYLWGVIAHFNGKPVGEFLAGPVDASQSAELNLSAAGLDPGQYLIATPYDWGEARITVNDPPPTATPTPTAKPIKKHRHHRAHCGKKLRKAKKCKR